MGNFLNDCVKLKRLIAENPNIPLIFFATDEANSGEYTTETCNVRCYVDEVLDCKGIYEDKIYMDREDLEEDISDMLWEDFSKKHNVTSLDFDLEVEFEELVATEMIQYEPYWKKCICVICE